MHAFIGRGVVFQGYSKLEDILPNVQNASEVGILQSGKNSSVFSAGFLSLGMKFFSHVSFFAVFLLILQPLPSSYPY